jgi:hypothetical protein
MESINEGSVVLVRKEVDAKKLKTRHVTVWSAVAEVIRVFPDGLNFELRWKTPGLSKEAVGDVAKRIYSRA